MAYKFELPPQEQVTVDWTPEMLERFKEEYKKHEDDPKAIFTFEGNRYMVRYSMYLIPHLEDVFA